MANICLTWIRLLAVGRMGQPPASCWSFTHSSLRDEWSTRRFLALHLPTYSVAMNEDSDRTNRRFHSVCLPQSQSSMDRDGENPSEPIAAHHELDRILLKIIARQSAVMRDLQAAARIRRLDLKLHHASGRRHDR